MAYRKGSFFVGEIVPCIFTYPYAIVCTIIIDIGQIRGAFLLGVNTMPENLLPKFFSYSHGISF